MSGWDDAADLQDSLVCVKVVTWHCQIFSSSEFNNTPASAGCSISFSIQLSISILFYFLK